MQRNQARRIASRLTAGRFGRQAAAFVVAAALAAAPLGAAPLAPEGTPPLQPMLLTGGFGDLRSNHFHAGLDLSTNRQMGWPVRAGGSGWFERVRTSGVGYGRSLYLRTTDGRLFVYGHLDAFDGPVAAYADSVQRASGDYEQDLYPPPGRFRVKEGDRIAFTGSSGAGGPHLHVEVRHGDFALNPLRAGLGLPDAIAPRLIAFVLEPLDDTSYVERGAAPLQRAFAAKPETLVVEGRARLTVAAEDPLPNATDLVVWSLGFRWNGQVFETRRDSISWATDMPEIDYLVDRGRVNGSRGTVLWAGRKVRPRFVVTPLPDSLEAGTLEVKPGDPARELVVFGVDAAGNRTERSLFLRGPRAGERGPAARRGGAAPKGAAPRWSFTSLPDGHLRVRLDGAPAGLTDAVFERARSGMGGRPATWDGTGWSAILRVGGLPDEEGLWFKARGVDGKAWWNRGAWTLFPGGTPFPVLPEMTVEATVDAEQAFEPGVLAARLAPSAVPTAELKPVSPLFELLPATFPLRKPFRLRMSLARDIPARRVGLYRLDGAEWTLTSAAFQAFSHAFIGEVSKLGTFGLFEDLREPLITGVTTLGRGGEQPYSRWALVAKVGESGSGIDAAASGFSVGGTRVATEWDPDAGELRWRPRTPPAPGTHAYTLTVVDKAGNRSARKGTFVIASPSR